MYVAGTTSGGAPFGTSEEDFRRNNEQWEDDAGWARAKRALRAALAPSVQANDILDIGYIEALAGGLERDAFGTSVYLMPDPQGLSGAYVCLIPHGDDPRYEQALEREFEVLRWLSDRPLDLRVPRAVALVEDRGVPILVESFIEGIAVDLRAGKQPIRPWEFVAEVASTIHAIPPPPGLPARPRREHRLELIEELERASSRSAVADEALAWMREHLDDVSGAGALCHGDLLGQNLRLHPSDRPGVIDWHRAKIGDPAADLAVVTRGIRRPFQLDDGRRKLLDEYNARAETEVSADSLRFFELAMVTRWLIDTRDRHQSEAYRNQIERMLRGE